MLLNEMARKKSDLTQYGASELTQSVMEVPFLRRKAAAGKDFDKLVKSVNNYFVYTQEQLEVLEYDFFQGTIFI